MACVVCLASLRSIVIYDAAGFVVGNRQHVFLAMKQELTWIGATSKSPESGWATHGPSDAAFLETELEKFRSRPRAGEWIIPYWCITVPLTLISAFLLLSKPRK